MADVRPLNEQPVSDDDELANVLAGVKDEAARLDIPTLPTPPADGALTQVPVPELQFEETPIVPVLPQVPVLPPLPVVTPASVVTEQEPAPYVLPVAPEIPVAPVSPIVTTPVASTPELESLKKDALSELRPLVDKLNLPAEEKFDTLLLIIRTTDDQSLLAPAHQAAKEIGDETRRAQALLDVIKEIDYFSTKG